jgi:PAS domain S-box-containing protein
MDIRTLAVILGIIQVAELVVFAMLASVNRAYRGIGWWLRGSALAAVGMLFMILRAFPALRLVGVLAQDTLILLAVIFFYVGIMRFLGRREPWRALTVVFTAFLATHVYFIVGRDDIHVRTIALCLALVVVSLLTAVGLWQHKMRSIRATANFLAVAFAFNGAYFAFRGVSILLGASLNDMFNPSLFNASVLLNGITVSILWTGGLILMVDQRANADMAEARQHFESIFSTSPGAAVITSLDEGTILDINHGFTEMTGLSRAELIGRSSLEVHIWKDARDRSEIVRRLREAGSVENFEAEFLARDGRCISGLMSAKIIQLHGRPHILSVTSDISERKRSEERIKTLLHEKEIILREVHHRIKNNMNSMMALLTIQAEAMKSPEPAAALLEARSRLQAMGVLYDKLYRSENVQAISVKDYIPSLVDEIVRIFPSPVPVKVETKITPFMLGVEVLSPLGIIINELVSNALKYAFKGKARGTILVTAERTPANARVTVEDDGCGIGAQAGDGFGLQLVEMLARQINGTLNREKGVGTKFVLKFDA